MLIYCNEGNEVFLKLRSVEDLLSTTDIALMREVIKEGIYHWTCLLGMACK